MYVNLEKTLAQLKRNLPNGNEHALQALTKMYDITIKLRSQLLALIRDAELYNETAKQEQPSLAIRQSYGQVSVASEVILQFQEPLPSIKELTAATEDHWLSMIHTAIAQTAAQQELPYFQKALVEIELVTTKGSKNPKVWDTSNRAINLIINNLKGTFFHDDDMEHMAFSVVAYWGEKPVTIVRISEFDETRRIGPSDF